MVNLLADSTDFSGDDHDDDVDDVEEEKDEWIGKLQIRYSHVDNTGNLL